MMNFCMSAIADDLTASVVLGEFKTWSKTIEKDDPNKYLYNQTPSIPSFQIWYPVSMDIIRENKWYFPHVYSQCRAYFESPLP